MPTNSTSAPINWLWQAERFLIWSDGINLPVFFDGNSARRSLGASPSQLGVTAVDFTVPTQNQFVSPDITLVSNWPSGTGLVLIGSALYNVQSFTGAGVGGRITLGLNNISGTINTDSIAAGTAILLNNKYCGTILAATDVNGAGISAFPPLPTAGTPGLSSVTINVLSPASPAASTVPTGTIVNDSPQYCGLITASSLSTFPNAPVAATGAQSFVVNFSATTVFDPAYNFQESYAGMSVGDTIQVNGYPCIVNSLTHNLGNNDQYIISAICTPKSSAATGHSISGTVTPVVHTICGQTLNGICQYYISTLGSAISGSGSGVMNGGSSVIPNQFTLTFSKSFVGAVKNVLSINGTTVKVDFISGAIVTCEMPSGYVANGTVIPTNVLVTNTSKTTPVTNFGTTDIISPATAPVVGNGMTLVMVPTSSTVVVGQTIEFISIITAGGGSQAIVGIVTAVSNGTVGQSDNYFRLTLSIPYTGRVWDIIQVGSGNTLATFKVIFILSSSVIQCQMTILSSVNNLGTLITSATPTTSQLVKNISANGTTTGVGLYPTFKPDGTTANPAVAVATSFSLQTTPSQTPATIGQIVQISCSNGNIDLFQIVSVSGGSAGTTPTIRIQNINDTEGNLVPAGTFIYSIPEIDVCRMGVYGMGRNWVSNSDGTGFVAGDLDGSSTGTEFYNYTDAVLKVSQNYFLAGGGTFALPGAGEQIHAMQFIAVLDNSLGQGPLQVFTDDTVFSCQAPTDMTTWSSLTSPILSEGLIGSGGISQDDVTPSNGDLIFRLADGGLQSLLMARLDFNKWGNTPISKEVSRSIKNDDPTLLPFSRGVVFNNRRLTTCQFKQAARGVYAPAMVSLQLDPISALAGKAPSVWESEWNGMNVLSFVAGIFNGSRQCYVLCLSEDLTQIILVQIMLDVAMVDDNTNSPISWGFESPMLFKEPENAGSPREYKRLVNGEFSVRDIIEDVAYQVFYRSDQNPNWTLWYSSTIKYQGVTDPGYRRRIPIGQPAGNVYDATNNQPLREGYNFQLKYVFNGACTFLNGRYAADVIPEPEFAKPI
jgi:hypothetical protein